VDPASDTDYDKQILLGSIGTWSTGWVASFVSDTIAYAPTMSNYGGGAVDPWAKRKITMFGNSETVTFYQTVPYAIRIVCEGWRVRDTRNTSAATFIAAGIADLETPDLSIPGASLINAPYFTARAKRVSRTSRVLGGVGGQNIVTFVHRSSKTKTYDMVEGQPWNAFLLPACNTFYVYYCYGERVFDSGTDIPGTGSKGATTSMNSGTGNHFWGPVSMGLTTGVEISWVYSQSAIPINIAKTDTGDTKPLISQGNLFSMGNDQEPHGGFSLGLP